MTIAAETNKVTYTCDGSKTEFDFTFKVFQTSDIKVILITVATGAETVLTETTHYAITGSLSSGGKVTTVETYSSSYKLLITIGMDLDQETDLVYGGSYSSEAIETMADKLTKVAQQHDEEISRTVKFQIHSSESDVEMEDLVADKLIIVNSDGDGLEMGPDVSEVGGGTGGGGGGVDTSGTPADNDFAKFTDADTIEGRSYNEVRSDLGIEAGATADQTKTDIDGLGLSHDSLSDVSANDHHNESHNAASHSDIASTGANIDSAVSLKHAATLIGTKTIDETDIANSKVITYNSASGNLEYEPVGTPGAHASSHENAGGDEVSVTGLSGLLADDQHVLDAEVLAVAAAKGANADITSMTGLNDDGIPLAKVAGLGSAAARNAEDAMTDGSNLPDGHAVKTYGDANWGGGGYTNLTSFVDQTAWKMFRSNANGDVVEGGFGADGTYLKSNGPAASPSWATPSGSSKWTDQGDYYYPNNWDYMRILDSDRLDIADSAAFTSGFPWDDYVTYPGSSAGSMVNIGQESSTDGNPPLWVQKKFNKPSASATHFAGAGHFEVWKQSGSTLSYISALTGNIIQECAYPGDAIGIHGRARKKGGGNTYAGWFSAIRDIDGADGHLHGIEIDIKNNQNDETFGDTVVAPADMGLWVYSQNSTYPSLAAIAIGADSDTNTFFNGLLFNTHSVRPVNGVGINMYSISPQYGIKFSACGEANIYYATTTDGLRIKSLGHTININSGNGWWYWRNGADIDKMRLNQNGNLSLDGTLTENAWTLDNKEMQRKWNLMDTILLAYRSHDGSKLDPILQVKVDLDSEDVKIGRRPSDFIQIAIECISELKEKTEEQALYVLQLHERLKTLEGK